ncbi:MAG: hypothetical protein ABJN26_09475 [Stappiaceae bacterium]
MRNYSSHPYTALIRQFQIVLEAIARIQRTIQRRRQLGRRFRAVQHLDEHLLRDAGFDRYDARLATHKSRTPVSPWHHLDR